MILAIDASTSGCSVALFNENKVLVSLSSRIERSSAENLTMMIEEVIRLGGIAYADLKAVAVAKGPGSYTGLRIAVSTAKGLSFGLDIPLISFGTLEALCHQITGAFGVDLLCPMIDARRMEVFCGFYKADTIEEVAATEAVLVDENSFQSLLNDHRVLFFGEGSEKCKAILTHPNAIFAEHVIYPSAESACLLVSEKFRAGIVEDLVAFEPFYLKEYMFKTK